MLEDQGIDVCPSPGGSSASGTSSRHSMSSVDSGRASGSDKVGTSSFTRVYLIFLLSSRYSMLDLAHFPTGILLFLRS